MTVPPNLSAVQLAEHPLATPGPKQLRWWKEVVIIVGFYVVYSSARNLFGSARVDQGEEPVQAFHNALRIIRLERFMGLYHEETLQDIFLPYEWFIRIWNIYYGSFHFLVTIGAFITLYLKMPVRFTRWRNGLAFTTAFAIVGFSLFPLMPPRLLNEDGPYGGARLSDDRGYENFGYVDTLEDVGGLWSFDSSAMAELSNQYAAMPSMHVGWSTWCTLALWPLTRRRWWAKALLVLYPSATLFCIIVTANHFWLDGVGGLVTLFFGYHAGAALDRWNDRRLLRKLTAESEAHAETVTEQ